MSSPEVLEMAEMTRVQLFSEGGDTWLALAPEMTLLSGLVLLFIVPNLGDAKWRIPLTQVRIPVLFGGRRFAATSDPRLPAMLAIATLLLALWQALISQGADAKTWLLTSGSGAEANILLRVDAFSRIFEIMFYSALLLAAVASIDRLPARRDGSEIQQLIDNRRQVDFYLLLLMTAFGMSIVTMSMDLFVLFIGLEIASLSIYVLVAFHKETPEGAEGGVKYFIVGAVSSAVALYGISLLYLWNGNLQLMSNSATGQIGLVERWAEMESLLGLPLIAFCFVLVGFAFKVSAVPFHFAAPDAYSGASSTVAGILATASKAMGFIGLIRVLVMLAAPADGSAVWMFGLGVIAVVTMTWGNVAALSSSNPKRMLAYSSIAHAGYMLAALAALGAWAWGGESDLISSAPTDAGQWILTALIFHLVVLVAFKLGAFLVLALLETEGEVSDTTPLAGLARRDPIIAVSMFIFMLSLAGVPPLAGFMSKFLLIGGVVKMSAGDAFAAIAAGDGWSLGQMHWTFWLALSVFLNSALSLFYYLRIGVIMFFEVPIEGRRKPLIKAWFLRLSIWVCAIGTVIFGVWSDHLINLCYNAALAVL
jgi:NADH-quinone oxidoreductase subunit N